MFSDVSYRPLIVNQFLTTHKEVSSVPVGNFVKFLVENPITVTCHLKNFSILCLESMSMLIVSPKAFFIWCNHRSAAAGVTG